MNTPFTVSNHSLGIILSCQRAGYLYKVRRRVRATEVKPGADAGAALHDAMARYRKGATMAEACVELATFVNGEDYRTGPYLVDAMRAYERHWGDDRATFKAVAVELPFTIQLADWLTYEGRIDLVYEHPDGRLVVRDLKSGKQFGNTDLDRFARNPGTIGYILAASRMLGRPCVTTELDSLTMRAPLVKERADSKPRFEMHRAQFTFDNERIEEWRVNVLRNVTAFLRAVDTDTVTMNENSCVTNFGKCPYYDCCELPISQRDTLLNSDMYRDYVPRVASTTD